MVYVPNAFRDEDAETVFEFMRSNSFAMVVSALAGTPVATHLPLSVQREGKHLTLRGHFAKANPQWRALGEGETLAVFSGPHAYVSPVYYDKRESVPTWNYMAVHAYGRAQLLTTDSELEGLLADLIAQNEPEYQGQWDNLPERYREGMRKGIVGFEISISRLASAAKLSQNKTEAERERIAAALTRSSDAAARATGEEMCRRLRDHSD